MTAALPADATVAVIGAGAMGAGIAQIAALAGHRVQLHDTRFGAADAAKTGIADDARQAGRQGPARAGRRGCGGRRGSRRSSRCPTRASRELVVEAIVEDLAAKRELFARLENVVTPECILASNTSSLSITALAAGLKHPGRVVGMHFFNPAPVMPLVEIVSGLATSTDVARDGVRDGARLGQDAGARVVDARASSSTAARGRSTREALRLLPSAPPIAATLDAVMREAGGFRMGPFELIDLIGLDVNLAVTTSVWEAYFHDPRYAPSVLQQELVAAGFLGRKTGRGFYDYAPGAAKPEPRDRGDAQPAPARVTVHGDLGIASRARRSDGSGGRGGRARARRFAIPGRRDPRRRQGRRRMARAHRRAHGDGARGRDGRARPRAVRSRARLRDGDAPRRRARRHLRRRRVRVGRRRAAGGGHRGVAASTTSPASR